DWTTRKDNPLSVTSLARITNSHSYRLIHQ
ncbi:hypothetical protein Gotri_026075, partial [Gossypium trilobum]|nr:hypothetical protein [Gossypium trilobum]